MASLGNLSNEIMMLLNSYGEDVKEGVKEATEKVSAETVATLKSDSPKKTGAYASGWTKKKMGTGYVVHNKTHYQLTHLLEKGHAKVNGGRVPPAKIHIKPAEEQAIERLEAEIIRVVQQG